MLKRSQARVKEVARLLERAAKKHNESADATCSVAGAKPAQPRKGILGFLGRSSRED